MVVRRPLFVAFLFLILFIGIWYHFSGEDENNSFEKLFIECVGRIEQIQIKTSGKVLILSDVQALNIDSGERIETDNILIYDFSEKNLFSNSQIGNVIKIKGSYSTFERASNPGSFDEYLYYQGQRISGKVFAESLTIQDSRCNWIRQKLFEIRQRGMEQLLRVMSEEDAGVLGAMILGEKLYLPADTKEQFQQVGIGHMLAISGLHISMLGAGVFFFLRSYILSMKKAVIVTIIFLLLYGELTGFPVATTRAVIMLCCNLFARYIGRSYDAYSAMSLAGIITLLQNPYQLFQCGFILSYTAIIGILLFEPVMEKLRPTLKKKTWGGVVESFISSASVFAVTLPVMLWFFYEICPYSILANLIVLPFLSLLIGVGIVGCVISFFWQDGGSFFLSTAHYILKYYEMVCQIIKEFPASNVVTGRPSWLFMIVYYLVLIGMVYIYVKWERKKMFGVGTLALLICLFFARPQFEFVYTQLDVGQGDCACIFYDDKTYLIDGGSTSEEEVGKYMIQKFLKYHGRDSVDMAFITHSDADHTSGILELVKNQKDWGIEIKAIVLPEIEKKDEAYSTIIRTFSQSNTKIFKMEKGDVLKAGGFQMRCLHPTPDYEWESENDYSLTLDISYQDLNILATGDLEAEGESVLKLPTEDYDVLKVGHHGSKTSTTQEFIEQVKPKIALISCGKGNRYGHPAKEVVERLEKMGSRIYLTMESGAVMIEVGEGIKRYKEA